MVYCGCLSRYCPNLRFGTISRILDNYIFFSAEGSHRGLLRSLVPQSGMPLRGREHNIKMYQVYILQSIIRQKYYIGHTKNIENRLYKHNKGLIKSTKYGKPWKLVLVESYKTRAEAYKRELEIKNYKGGIKFKKLLGLWKE